MARHIQIAATSNRRRGGAGAAAFEPSDIAGCQQFVEMDRGVEETDGSVPENGENIAAWRDEWSGNDNDFLQGTLTNQPVYDTSLFGGYSAKFDDINDVMSAGNPEDMNFERDEEIYLIIGLSLPTAWPPSGDGFLYNKSDSSLSGGQGWNITYFSGSVNGQADVIMWSMYHYPPLRMCTMYGNTDIGAASAGTKYIVECWSEGTGIVSGSHIAINGVEDTPYETYQDNLGTYTIKSTSDVNLGDRGGSAVPALMNFACAGAWNRIPTDDERTSLRAYISDKYGF